MEWSLGEGEPQALPLGGVGPLLFSLLWAVPGLILKGVLDFSWLAPGCSPPSPGRRSAPEDDREQE
jgi:hypothetical protein